jgi:hypothetical protein
VEAGIGVAIVNDNHALYHNPMVKFIRVPGLENTVQAAAWSADCCNPAVNLFAGRLPSID